MGKYIMALDAGTTSNRCILFDKSGQIVAIAQKEFTQFFPKPGWVEHDPMEIWSTQFGVATEAMAKVGADADDIAAIGITNQRETTIVWDKNTGEPVYNAIVWQCRRTADLAEKLRADGYEDLIRKKTGLIIDPYFSATKIRWILDHIEKGQERAERGELLFGTVDTFLIWKLSKGKSFVTDYSNASRTMLYNIHELKWDDDILEILNIPKAMFADVVDSSSIFGFSDKSYFGKEIIIAGVAGDQQAALFGQTCFEEGDAKNTYGTGAFLLMNTGSKAVDSKKGLVTTIAWGIDGKITYALEGSIFSAGSAIQWLRDGIRIVDSAEDTAYMAQRVKDTGGCYMVPAFTGLGAPYWDPYARGILVGITRGTNKYHIVRATLEAEAYLSNDVLSAMVSDSSIGLRSLKVDGGGSANDFLMQFQADISKVTVERPKLLETTALGAAYLAGLRVGFWDNLSREIDRSFKPSMEDKIREEKIKNWKRAVDRSLKWSLE